MNVTKQSQVRSCGEPSEEQLAAINALAKGSLTEEQVYVFSLRLCDDAVDRDYERFDAAALPELARLFVGKAGIVDHKWSAEGQLARIFATEVVAEEGQTYIKAWAYIRRGGRGEEWIADIEAGIKKEVSVGCSMGRSVCSICGSDYGSCGHQKGELYEGALCCAILRDPRDAYEFSFVAVPAQRRAGVLKGMGSRLTLKQLAGEFGAMEEYEELCKLAQLGREHMRRLEDETVQLALLLELGLREQPLRAMLRALPAQQLKQLRNALEEKVTLSFPTQPQLSGATVRPEEADSEFII